MFYKTKPVILMFSCEISNTLCSILEAILLHQHRGNKTVCSK